MIMLQVMLMEPDDPETSPEPAACARGIMIRMAQTTVTASQLELVPARAGYTVLIDTDNRDLCPPLASRRPPAP